MHVVMPSRETSMIRDMRPRGMMLREYYAVIIRAGAAAFAADKHYAIHLAEGFERSASGGQQVPHVAVPKPVLAPDADSAAPLSTSIDRARVLFPQATAKTKG